MRTLQEMRLRVDRKLNDLNTDRYHSQAIDEELEIAAGWLWNALTDDPVGRRCLRKVSDAVSLVANQEDYSIPADCLRILQVQISITAGSDIAWYDLVYRPEIETVSILSGTSALFSSGSAAGSPAYWNDMADAGNQIRLAPEPATALEAIRYIYSHKPTFPAADGEVFNEGATPVIPDGADELCEYLAIAYLSHEELEDGKPIGAFGAMFQRKYGNFISGLGGGYVRPVRRYVNRID